MDDPMLTFELRNNRPVDLIDLTTSLDALARTFQDYVAESGAEPLAEVRLAVKQLRSGSIIGDLVPTSDQVSWVLDHASVLAGFVGSLNDIAQYFLTGQIPGAGVPTKKQAERVAQVVEPVAKDVGAQFNIAASDGASVVFNISYLDANALQNGVRRLTAPTLPAEVIERGVLLSLEQVRNDAATKTGDRGIIHKISERPIRLRFMTPDAKMAIISRPDNPLKCTFLVDAKIHSVGGTPKLYEIIAVEDTIPSD